jgi:hypothetical protein
VKLSAHKNRPNDPKLGRRRDWHAVPAFSPLLRSQEDGKVPGILVACTPQLGIDKSSWRWAIRRQYFQQKCMWFRFRGPAAAAGPTVHKASDSGYDKKAEIVVIRRSQLEQWALGSGRSRRHQCTSTLQWVQAWPERRVGCTGRTVHDSKMSASGETHSLNLRVLRLQAPSYHVDLNATPLQDLLEGSSKLPIDSSLVLPTSFGACYLGQAFTALVCACNDSPSPVYAAALRIEVQTASVKHLLAETSVEQGAILQPGDFVHCKVSFEIKETGNRPCGRRLGSRV